MSKHSSVLCSLCLCSAWLSANGVSAEYALRGEDLHAVESSQRDQWGHHTVRGQSKTCNNTLWQLYKVVVQIIGLNPCSGRLQSVKVWNTVLA